MKNKRNTLIVIRLFSGLVSSVVKKNWRPTGIPAIYKIIEGMNNSGIKTDVLFLCKTDLESKNILNTESFRLEQDQVKNIHFHIVAFKNTKINGKKIEGTLSDILKDCKDEVTFTIKKKFSEKSISLAIGNYYCLLELIKKEDATDKQLTLRKVWSS